MPFSPFAFARLTLTFLSEVMRARLLHGFVVEHNDGRDHQRQGSDGHLKKTCRLCVSRFDQMRDDPNTHPLPQFAGERVRGAEAVVKLIRRKPVHIVRMTFSILTFDQKGCLK